MQGDSDAMSRLIRSLADDLYGCRPAQLQGARDDLERALQEYSDRAPARYEIEILWELTHVFLSKIPLSLWEFTRLGSTSVESAILNRFESDDALEPAELCDLLDLGERAVKRAVDGLEKLGLLARLPGDALRLTRDGREVKRWMQGQRSAARVGGSTEPAPGGASDLVGSRSLLQLAGDDLQVLRPAEARELEAKVALDTEIWVLGIAVPNGGAFFATVAENLRRGVQYYYLCPRAEFRALWSKLARSFSEERLRGQLACIVNAPALLRLNTARVHVLPDERKLRSLRVCWLGSDRPEPFYLAVSTPASLDPNGPLLDSYRRAARRLIASSGDPEIDYARLEEEVRSL